jgi:DNA-directed RNA polymerase III subunit RPC8
MFILSIIKDVIKVNPQNFAKSKLTSIQDELNIKYANKVLHNVGLCIRVWDITTLGDCVIPPSQDGSFHVKVEFRLIVFRPFIGEILECKVQSCGTEGIRVALDFFDEISISYKHLPSGCELYVS